jgi:hypothetical protein
MQPWILFFRVGRHTFVLRALAVENLDVIETLVQQVPLLPQAGLLLHKRLPDQVLLRVAE